MKKLLITGVCCLVVVLAYRLWPTELGTPVTLVSVDDPSHPPANPTRADPDARLIMLSGHPLSLTGNTLKADPEVIRLFDDWAQRNKDEDFDLWKRGSLDSARQTLPPEALAQLERWIDQYAELNLSMQLMTVNGAPEWNKILADVEQLRSVYFAESDRNLFSHARSIEEFTRDAMSAAAAGMDERALSSLGIKTRDLLPQERVKVQAWIDSLRDTLNSEDWPNYSDEEQRRLIEARVASLLAGPSIDFGDENTAFLQRYEVYSQERETLEAQGADADTLARLRERHFEGIEQTRAITLDRALAQ